MSASTCRCGHACLTPSPASCGQRKYFWSNHLSQVSLAMMAITMDTTMNCGKKCLQTPDPGDQGKFFLNVKRSAGGPPDSRVPCRVYSSIGFQPQEHFIFEDGKLIWTPATEGIQLYLALTPDENGRLHVMQSTLSHQEHLSLHHHRDSSGCSKNMKTHSDRRPEDFTLKLGSIRIGPRGTDTFAESRLPKHRKREGMRCDELAEIT